MAQDARIGHGSSAQRMHAAGQTENLKIPAGATAGDGAHINGVVLTLVEGSMQVTRPEDGLDSHQPGIYEVLLRQGLGKYLQLAWNSLSQRLVTAKARHFFPEAHQRDCSLATQS